MREIKFRAWIKGYDWLEDGDIYKTPHMYNWHSAFFCDCSPVTCWSDEFPDGEDVILMQYTGLKDKNGKEIYEGDIVRDSGNGDVGEIVWGVYEWYCTLDFGTDLNKALYRHCEVIGNIYENPSLLEEVKT
jgi:uncharacterized phage protein (TIGR01671 family)